MSSSPSKLDLTGQGSEDEPSSCLELHQQQQQPREHHGEQLSQSKELQPEPQSHLEQNKQEGTKQNENSTNDDNNSGGHRPSTSATTARTTTQLSSILTSLPSPLDLWHSGTPTSLLLLPFVFFLYILLQLPLHHNSSSYDPSIDPSALTPQQWTTRSKDIFHMQAELNSMESHVEKVKAEQSNLRGVVGDLRRRLKRMKEQREFREEFLKRRHQQQEQQQVQHQVQQQQHQGKQGVVNAGPIATISMAHATAVATFVGGKSNSNHAVDDSKKSD